MTGYKKYFDAYCREQGLNLYLSFEMPAGYKTAKGTFDASSRTVFINAEGLDKEPEYERMFYLFHELRHASQYLEPERFNETINRSIQYIIMFDGTCYKLVKNHYLKCKLEGGEGYFTSLYLGQPHEVDANTFAYEQTRKICGDSAGLKEPFLPMRFLRILQIRTARMKTIRVMQRIQTQRQQDLRCLLLHL